MAYRRIGWHHILHGLVAVHFLAYVVLFVFSFGGTLSLQDQEIARADTFSVRDFLAKSAPNTNHEANPHGVPPYYDWYTWSKVDNLTAPRPETTHVNFWGEIYADLSNTHPANTRVELRDCQFWALFSTGSWTKIQDTTLDGGAWTEDYTTYVEPIDIRSESGGGQSILPRANQNSHFWADTGFYDVAGRTFLAAFSTCQTRLVLNDANGVDDRDQANYILSMGADWRQPNGACPFIYGAYICEGMGHGKYITVEREWRTAVFSTMTTGNLDSLPLPSESIFMQPDGSYPDMAPEITSFTATPSTLSAAGSVNLQWNATGAGSYSIDQGIGVTYASSATASVGSTTTYTLTASNKAGSSTRQATVSVGSGSSGGSNPSTSPTTPTPSSGGSTSTPQASNGAEQPEAVQDQVDDPTTPEDESKQETDPSSAAGQGDAVDYSDSETATGVKSIGQRSGLVLAIAGTLLGVPAIGVPAYLLFKRLRQRPGPM